VRIGQFQDFDKTGRRRDGRNRQMVKTQPATSDQDIVSPLHSKSRKLNADSKSIYHYTIGQISGR